LIFAKPPMPGVSKTRLAQDIGVSGAARVARRLQAHTIRLARRIPQVEPVLCVAPFYALHTRLPGIWPNHSRMARVRQSEGSLGDRLTAAFMACPNGPVLVIGTDCPELRRAHIALALKALRSADVVIGPASDGGFWLFGCHKRPNWVGPFADVRWSGPYALADVRARFPAGTRVTELPLLADIDDGLDYDAWGARNGHTLAHRP
jgi:rSAM/selenodomain-associated transferase 1